MAAGTETRVEAGLLRRFVAGLFEDTGCRGRDAEDIAQCLVQSNLWGIDSHGVIRVPEYLARFRSGAMNALPQVSTLQSSPGFDVLDADNGAGYLAGRAAMTRAIELAGDRTIAAAGVINSNHCGATALYARMAADRGMIGIAMTNVAPNMVMPGARQPITGNNPLAIAIPTFAEFPFVLDISLSAVAGGKLLVAAKKGEPIPLGWATDKEGRPTTNAQAGFEGYLLPMGGHKGYGLSLAIDILCGLITGGSFQNQVKSMYRFPADPSRTAHLMMVINPLALMSREQLQERMHEFFSTVKNTPVADDGTEILLPGELEYRSERQRSRDGIPLPAAVYEQLARIGQETNRSMENG
jgi:LDH2 family malate/lactate/ureidoglycolate dehydrogenase